jgi:orotidine-5'-phosphate decarboxylase
MVSIIVDASFFWRWIWGLGLLFQVVSIKRKSRLRRFSGTCWKRNKRQTHGACEKEYWHLKVFLDLKFFDVPETVKLAVRTLNDKGVSFTTVHGNDAMLRAAVEAAEGLGILAVTALTSLDEKDMEDLGFQCPAANLVLSRARRALEIGCHGVISSGLEAPILRKELGEGFLVVTPGIRPVKNVDDQKRTVDVKDAFENGADHIVVGRPLRDAKDPIAVIENMQESIAQIVGAPQM